MTVTVLEFDVNTIQNKYETFMAMFDKNMITKEEVSSFINRRADDFYYRTLPAHPKCVFMLKETHDNVFGKWQIKEN